MRCTDRLALACAPGVLLAVAGCSPRPAAPVAEAPASSAVEAPAASPVAQAERPAPMPSAPFSSRSTPAAPHRLDPPHRPTSHDDLRRQAALRLVAANPDGSYLGPVPEPLLAIPVLEVNLRRDGSVERIVVLRAPRQARDTSQLAIAAVHRAAPFGDVSHLPRPWRFTETFLFDEHRRFKPRTLDE